MPCNTATPEFMAMLSKIEPSRVTDTALHYPCRIRLKDDRWIDRVICTEDARGFTGDWWVHPDDVSEIVASEECLPSDLATKLYGAGESGMGYEVFEVSADGHESFSCITYNVVDFPTLPDSLKTPDIRNVYPHRGSQWYGSPRCFEKPRDFTWCYFVHPSTEQGGGGNSAALRASP